MSLTGDPRMDRLIPIAMQLVGAVRTQDQAGVADAFDAANRLMPGEADRAIAVLLAAMVPWDKAPSELLAWWVRRADYHKLIAAGVDPATAMTLIEGGAEWSTGNSGSGGQGAPGSRSARENAPDSSGSWNSTLRGG